MPPIPLATSLLLVALVAGCASSTAADASRSDGALVANGTCAPVVSRTFACDGTPPSTEACEPGTKPVARVLQRDGVGSGAHGAGYTCSDADGTAHYYGSGATSCDPIGDWYALAYTDCATRHQELTAFAAREECAASACSIVVTCCPG